MYKYRCIIETTPGPSGGDPFCLLANCFLFVCRDPALFIFIILSDFKYSIQIWDRVSALWDELHIAYTPIIILV